MEGVMAELVVTEEEVKLLRENAPDIQKDPSSLVSESFETFESFMQAVAPSLVLSSSIDASSLQDTVNLYDVDDSGPHPEGLPSSHEEIKYLKETVALLRGKLDATSKIVEIQEKEMCCDMTGDEIVKSNYENMLTRWRREVCGLLLKQRVDALQVEQRKLLQTQREQHLTVQLHEARALVEVLKQKERNLQAEIGILTTGQKLAEITMRAEAARRQHEMEGTAKGVTRVAMEGLCALVEEHSAMIFRQLERVLQASCRKRLEENTTAEKPRSPDRRKERTPQGDNVLRRSSTDHSGRATQLEVLLAATKSQLAEECLHSRGLQERVGRLESESREAVKKATRKVQEQAERDLMAIKRQHCQIVHSLHQRIAKLQNEHAKSIMAYHHLERKLSNQQQEFVHTLNQRDNEFRKSLDAKEIEVNALLDEQNALLNKLKKFWRPILNSSAAKIFTDKNQRSQLHTPVTSQNLTFQESKMEFTDTFLSKRSVETQTLISEARREKKKKTSTEDESKSEIPQQKDERPKSVHQLKKEEKAKVDPQQKEEDKRNKKATKEGREVKVKKTESQPSSRLSTPGRKKKPDSKVKKSEDDLISSYLNKLQKTYVTTNKPYLRETTLSRLSNSSCDVNGDLENSPRFSSTSQQAYEERIEADEWSRPRHPLVPYHSQRDTSKNKLPEFIICVPQDDARVSNSLLARAHSDNPPERRSDAALQQKLESLEVLGETLLGQRQPRDQDVF